MTVTFVGGLATMRRRPAIQRPFCLQLDSATYRVTRYTMVLASALTECILVVITVAILGGR